MVLVVVEILRYARGVEVDEARAAVLATLARLGVADTQLGAVGETIERASPHESGIKGLPTLDFDRADGAGAAGADFVLVSEIARGGMGVIRLAEQRSLGRHVAVKTATGADDQVRAALVREARILGALEHPNLVPVHALGLDASGAPALVMKRIEGVSWRRLLDDLDDPAWRPLLAGHGDRLRASVEILVSVCRALAFAHDRGVVHRDLKPENVMIGRFGEVYLLDWGVALRLSERDQVAPELVGTPAYLAPEMVRADPKAIETRTDVFLLGATLYEILVGRAPNVSDKPDPLGLPPVQAALVRAMLAEPPELPASAPVELATLVKSAMVREVEGRLASAELFRERLAHFLVSREADVVAVGARASLARARAEMEAEGPASTSAFRSLVEARFGFTTALRLRADDEALRAELEEVNVASIERELALRSPQGARALLADIAAPNPDLETRISELEGEMSRERSAKDELLRGQREADTSAAARPLSRTVFILWAVGVSVGSVMAFQTWKAGSGFPVQQALLFDVFAATLIFSLSVAWRRRLFATEASRRLTLSFIFLAAFLAISDCASFLLGRTTSEATVHTLLVAAAISLMSTLAISRQLWPCGPTYLLGSVSSFLWPRYAPVFAMMTLTVNAIFFIRAFRSQASKTPS